jgi:Fic family protein
MIFQTPLLGSEEQTVLGMILDQRQTLRHYVNSNPRRWTGFLRRNAFARAIQGSNSIEGYHATEDDVIAVVEDEEPIDASRETWLAITGYRNALTYILRLAEDPYFEFHQQLIRSLHFIMLGYDLGKQPGQWRPGYIAVIRQDSGEKVYEGPDAQLVPSLIDELIEQLRADADEPAIVRASMAHLNLTMIHPFKDGNGRMARALQTLVLAREGIMSPTFASIEEWLGANTQAYYAVLADVGQGSWHPENDALPWVRFCLRAHYQQAATLIKRNNEMRRVWEQVSTLVSDHGLPERCEIVLVESAFGFRIRNVRYRSAAEVSEHIAGRDLKHLADLGLLVAHGEKRGRFYVGSEQLRAIREASRDARRAEDPFALVAMRSHEEQARLPGL